MKRLPIGGFFSWLGTARSKNLVVTVQIYKIDIAMTHGSR